MTIQRPGLVFGLVCVVGGVILVRFRKGVAEFNAERQKGVFGGRWGRIAERNATDASVVGPAIILMLIGVIALATSVS